MILETVHEYTFEFCVKYFSYKNYKHGGSAKFEYLGNVK
jgi:hypothetical protein